MKINRLQQLAGLPEHQYDMLNEATVIPGDASLEQIEAMLDAAKRGIGMANRLQNPEDKKKHLRAIFTNLNKIRAALGQFIGPLDQVTPQSTQPQQPALH